MAYVVLLAKDPYRRSSVVYRLGVHSSRENAEQHANSVAEYLARLGFKIHASPNGNGFDLVKDHQNHVFLAVVEE